MPFERIEFVHALGERGIAIGRQFHEGRAIQVGRPLRLRAERRLKFRYIEVELLVRHVAQPQLRHDRQHSAGEEPERAHGPQPGHRPPLIEQPARYEDRRSGEQAGHQGPQRVGGRQVQQRRQPVAHDARDRGHDRHERGDKAVREANRDELTSAIAEHHERGLARSHHAAADRQPVWLDRGVFGHRPLVKREPRQVKRGHSHEQHR